MAVFKRLAPTLALVAWAALIAPAASARVAAEPWPPDKGDGLLFVHFGEEHWNDDDSDLTLPKVVAEVARYRPDLVTMSGDKANDGTVDQLTRWKQIMSAFDQAGVPYLPGIGNHDRTSPPGVPPGTAGLITPGIQGSLTNYRNVFADRPYPFGDAAPYAGIGPTRPGGDPAGASSHYFADVGGVRWIFLDNSCWGISDCDSVQNPPFPDSEGTGGQFEFLERMAREATDAGRVVFVVMHIPTRDPRDQDQIDDTSFNHVMGKGISPSQSANNAQLEQVAERSGVDGVFTGHIKGQWLYRGAGNVPFYIDGGAGGELYTNGPLGVDHGYWHGFRVLRVRGTDVATDMVPILRPGSIEISGRDLLPRGRVGRYDAFGEQAKKVGPEIEVELRDADPIPKQSSRSAADRVGAFLGGGGMILLPPALMLALLAAQGLASSRRRRAALAPAAATAILLGGLGAVALAQHGTPTSTPRSSLPDPARIWTSSNPYVLQPVAFGADDPRRDRATQTEAGAFRARCPGDESVAVTSGFEESVKNVVVPSRKGKIVGSIKLRGRKARVRLRQRAEVLARVKRGKKVVRVLAHNCFRPRKKLRFRWNGRVPKGRAARKAPRGRYKMQVLVLSDRKTVRRSRGVRIR